MTEEEIEGRMADLATRYCTATASHWPSLSLVMWPGHWAITSAGGTVKMSASGEDAATAIANAEIEIERIEARRNALAKTLGVEAA